MKVSVLLIMGLLISYSGRAQESTDFPTEVANYYGISEFEKIKSIEFVFMVNIQQKQISRHWKWDRITNIVMLVTDEGTVAFTHNNAKSDEERSLDGKFINDSYWLLFPYHLIWDKGNYELTVVEEVPAPISKLASTKIIINYSKGDGYTPNDIYELYLNGENEITEWVYRSGGAEKPTVITTWEKTIDYDGVRISTLHHGSTSNFKLWFEKIEIEK